MKAGKFLKYFILLVVAGNLALVAYVFLGIATPKPTPMPNPNGYDAFVNAAQMISGMPPDPTLNYTQKELGYFISKNEAALKLGIYGLSQECMVPDDYSPTNRYEYFLQPMAIERLAHTFWAEGCLAKLQDQTNHSVESYLRCIVLGQKSCRGGFTYSKLYGIDFENDGRKGLESWADILDSQESRKICQILEMIDTQEEPVDAFLGREKKFIRNSTTTREKLYELTEFSALRKETKDFTDKFHQNQLLRRQMMIAFAFRAYELENGKLPSNASDLVPSYLTAIPKDPFTNTNLTLSR